MLEDWCNAASGSDMLFHIEDRRAILQGGTNLLITIQPTSIGP